MLTLAALSVLLFGAVMVLNGIRMGWFQSGKEKDEHKKKPIFVIGEKDDAGPSGEKVTPTAEKPGDGDFADTVSRDFRVHFLDVSQGAAVLITLGDDAVLIDGGGPKSSSFVVSYLKKQGITRLRLVVATHYDNDHLSGLVGALNVFCADEVWGPDYETDTRTYHSFCRILREQGITRKTPYPGRTIQMGELQIVFLAPGDGEPADENDYSAAMKITYRDFSMIITGDATENSEQRMLLLGMDLSCDLYYVAHHGSKYSSSMDFLNAMKPRVAILSVGADNTYGHPAKECLKRLERVGATLYRTDERGTITMTYGEEIIRMEFEKP